MKPANVLVTYAGSGLCARDGEWLPEAGALTGIWSRDMSLRNAPPAPLCAARLARVGSLVYKLGDLGQAVAVTERDPYEGDSR